MGRNRRRKRRRREADLARTAPGKGRQPSSFSRAVVVASAATALATGIFLAYRAGFITEPRSVACPDGTRAELAGLNLSASIPKWRSNSKRVSETTATCRRSSNRPSFAPRRSRPAASLVRGFPGRPIQRLRDLRESACRTPRPLACLPRPAELGRPGAAVPD